MKLHLCLLPCMKLNSKWIRDLDIGPDILTMTEGKTGIHWDSQAQER